MASDLSEKINQALNSFEISDYLDYEGIEYRRTTGTRGEQLNVHSCPVCGGSKWKVYLNADSGLGNCFHGSCEAKFNKFSFIRAHSGLEGMPFVDYLLNFAQEFGWLPKRKKTILEKKETELIIPESFAIPHEGKNLRYMEDRGIPSSISKYFGFRYCDKGQFYYYTPDGQVAYQVYDKRIIIPILDIDGKLVSFQGRDITGTSEKKYLFPPGFASTGAHLYNAHKVKSGTKRVVIGEGVFDVAAQKIAMVTDPDLRDVEPIGSFGKSLSAGAENSQLEKFITLKNKGVEEVTFMWDGEAQALTDAVKAGTMVKGLGFKTRIALLPFEKDPNEVPPEVVRKSFVEAVELNKTNAIRLLMKSPYK